MPLLCSGLLQKTVAKALLARGRAGNAETQTGRLSREGNAETQTGRLSGEGNAETDCYYSVRAGQC